MKAGQDLQPDSWIEFFRRDSACEKAGKQPLVTRTILTLGEADARPLFDEATILSVARLFGFWIEEIWVGRAQGSSKGCKSTRLAMQSAACRPVVSHDGIALGEG